MSVDAQTVARIARLARIRIPEERHESLAGELSGILSWIEQLNEVDTEAVEPLASVTGHPLPLREDAVTDGDMPEKILANAPEANANFFAVPKVVE